MAAPGLPARAVTQAPRGGVGMSYKERLLATVRAARAQLQAVGRSVLSERRPAGIERSGAPGCSGTGGASHDPRYLPGRLSARCLAAWVTKVLGAVVACGGRGNYH